MKNEPSNIQAGVYSIQTNQEKPEPGCVYVKSFAPSSGKSFHPSVRFPYLMVRYSTMIVSFFVLSIVFLISSCENDVKKIKELTENKPTKDVATNVESYLSQEGKMKAKLKAPLMIRSEADTAYVEFPNTLHVDFYNDSLQIETRLDSKYGKYFEAQNKVYLRDSVVVISVKGDTLRTPDLWWDQNTKLFYTDKYAIYHGIGKNIYGGKGLVATQDLVSITFNEPTGTVQVTDSSYFK